MPGAEGVSSHGSYGWSGQEAAAKSCGLRPVLLCNCSAPPLLPAQILQISSDTCCLNQRHHGVFRSVMRLNLLCIVRVMTGSTKAYNLGEPSGTSRQDLGIQAGAWGSACWTRHMLPSKAFLNLLEAGVEGGASRVFTTSVADWTGRVSCQAKYLLTSELTRSLLRKGGDFRFAPWCYLMNPF